MQKTLAVIPARLGSTRFPRKVLYPWRGKPLLFYVWNWVGKAKTIERVVIATDSSEIEKAARAFGAEVVRTSNKCHTGSDRAAEALKKCKAEIVVNVQADSLTAAPLALDMVVKAMQRDQSIGFATLAKPIKSDEELFDPNKVKLVKDGEGNALWFSRFPIPYLQHDNSSARWRQFPFLGHIGIYFFRAEALRKYARWGRTRLERTESLEQLRVLEHGAKMRVFMTNMKTISVDSPADLRRVAAG